MWETKYATAVPKNLEVGVDFRPFIEGDYLWASVVRDQPYFPSMCMVCRKPEFTISLSSEEKYHRFNFSSNVPAKDFAKPPYVLTVSKVSRS